MKAAIRLIVTMLGCVAVMTPALAQGARLAVGPDAGGYLCPDGRQLYVKSCFDEAPYAKCGVVNMHLPMRNGFQQVTSEERSEITAKLGGCKLYPLDFRDGVVSLIVPKNATQAQAPATAPAGNTIVVPGTDGKPLALVRLPPSADNTIIYYVDESSRKPLAQADTVGIWALWVFPKGREEFPGVTATWIGYVFNCKAGSVELGAMIKLDRQAKVLGSGSLDSKQQVAKGTMADKIAGVACQRGEKLTTPRLATTLAAINDAMPAAAAKPAAAPGSLAPLALVRVQTTSVFANFFDESAVFPASQQGIVAARGLTVFPGGDPDNKASGGRWVEYLLNCVTKDYDVTAVMTLDLQARPMGAFATNIQNTAPYAALADAISFNSCNRNSTPSTPRLKTTAEAFADAKTAVAVAASPAEQARRAAAGQVSRWLLECRDDKGASCTAAGRAYREGVAIGEKDLTKAANYLGYGCQMNDGEGCFTLSAMYRDGEGVNKDTARARQLFDKACTLKSPSCLAALRAGARP